MQLNKVETNGLTNACQWSDSESLQRQGQGSSQER